MTIGEKIKQLRGNMTLKEFAEIFQVSTSNISGIENNHSNPSFELASKICEHFNCSMDWLIRDVGNYQVETIHTQNVYESNANEEYKTKYIELLEKHTKLLEERVEKQEEKIRSNQLQTQK